MSLVIGVKEVGAITFPVKSGEVIEAGKCVGIDANGYAVRYVKANAGGYKKTFIAVNSFDNRDGSNGVLTDEGGDRCIQVYGYGSRLIVKSEYLTQDKVLGNVYGGETSINDFPTGVEKPVGILVASLGSDRAEILIQ